MKAEGIYLSWIIVKDIKKAIQFYTEIAGLNLKDFSEEYRWAELSGPGGTILGIGEAGHESPIQAGENAVVTIAVPNIDEARMHFTKKGAKLIGDIVEIPHHVKMQTFADSDGNIMQLVQKLS